MPLRLGGLHARRFGPASSGPSPLLLVHGLTDDGGCWPDAVAHWADRVVWTVDLPSHGLSPRLGAADLDDPLPVVAAACRAALTELADVEGRAAVGIGHSMGAGALVLAAIEGAPLDRLVLEDPRVAHPDTRVRERIGRMRAREVRAWHETPDAARAALVAACPRWSTTELDACAAARPLVDPALLATGRSGLRGDDDLQTALVARAAGSTPTLLVTGDRTGAIWTPDLLDAARTATPGLGVAVVEGGDHTVRRVEPPAYYAAVDRFLV